VTKTLKVQLPPSMANFFSEGGFTDTTYYETRKHSRLRCRCEADLRIDWTPPMLTRTENEMRVLVKDVSKCGMGLIVHEQLWPEERVTVTFMGRQAVATVVRCRRLGKGCYECGAKLISFESSST
jgi:hypothetical protein